MLGAILDLTFHTGSSLKETSLCVPNQVHGGNRNPVSGEDREIHFKGKAMLQVQPAHIVIFVFLDSAGSCKVFPATEFLMIPGDYKILQRFCIAFWCSFSMNP